MKENSKGFFKKVVRKNQVIIAALAVMIIIAGYLNLTGQSGKVNPSGTEVNEIAGGKGTEDAIQEGDMFTQPDIDPAGDNDQSVSGDDVEVSDNDANVTDGEIGDAVLASTVLGSGFFGNAKLNREQVRAANKEVLQGIINDSQADEASKKAAAESLINMTNEAGLEDELETLLEAKGYETVCYISEGNVDIVVNSMSLTDSDVAKIEDVVMRKAETDASKIVISNAVTED